MADPAAIAELVGRTVTVAGRLRTKKRGAATDVSGIASAAPLGRSRRKCLVIDNESLFAQFARLDLATSTLKAGRTVRLLPKDRDLIDAVGRPPDAGDPGPDEYILDGEAITWAAPHYYVTGSHSIHDWTTEKGRQLADYRRSAHLVTRVNRNGRQVELSYRLNDMLRADPTLAPFFLQSPNVANGINIEGLAGWRRRLYFGFRSPVLGGAAVLLSVRAAALFGRAADLAPRLLRVRLGEDTGIRDLAFLPDGRLLVLSGPRLDAYEGFAIQLFDRRTGSVTALGALRPEATDKPEALLLADLSPAADGSAAARLLVLSDHPENGRPRLYDLRIPPA